MRHNVVFIALCGLFINTSATKGFLLEKLFFKKIELYSTLLTIRN